MSTWQEFTSDLQEGADEIEFAPDVELPPPVPLEPRADDQSGHTWRALDLIQLGSQRPEPPDIAGLFYPGKRHSLSGESEAGKSWLLLAAAAAEVRADRGVVWIDSDDAGAADVLERLRSFGLEDARIARLFAYLRPAEALSDKSREDVLALLRGRQSRLVVFDALNPALVMYGLDPSSTTDVEQFFRRVIDPFRAEGAAVVSADHVVKKAEDRGRFAYGSERKTSGADVHLGLKAVAPFGRGLTGKATITVHKDRPGFIERPSPGLFVLASDADTGACAWRIEPDHGLSDEGAWRPTALMEKVSRHLEKRSEPCSRNQIEQAVQGKTDYKRKAIDALIAEGYAVEIEDGRSRLVLFHHAFRESDEWADS